MSIDTSVKSSNAYLDSLRIEKTDGAKYETEKERSELTQEDFFSLLTKQLAYQDPFKPVENAEMISQMTSFSTAEGITKLNDQIGSMNSLMGSSQALQASTLVGQKVLVPANTGHSSGKGFEGVVALQKDTKNMTISIEDKDGKLIKRIDLSDQESGTVEFKWDGTNSADNAVEEGNYVIKVTGLQDGKTVELPTAIYARVDSVSISNEFSQAALNLDGLGSVKLTDVIEISDN